MERPDRGHLRLEPNGLIGIVRLNASLARRTGPECRLDGLARSLPPGMRPQRSSHPAPGARLLRDDGVGPGGTIPALGGPTRFRGACRLRRRRGQPDANVGVYGYGRTHRRRLGDVVPVATSRGWTLQGASARLCNVFRPKHLMAGLRDQASPSASGGVLTLPPVASRHPARSQVNMRKGHDD